MKKDLFYSLSVIFVFLLFVISGVGCNSTPSDEKVTTTTSSETGISIDTPIETTNPNSSSTNKKDIESLNLDNDFITGVDVSSIISLEESGISFYDNNGNECDIFKLLSENGVTCIRVRIFNDPYDENHNTYGGGHNDLSTALAIGRRASAYNIPLYIDFHYSDFWADPKKQQAPKKWSSMTISEKEKAIYEYTSNCLTEFINNEISIKLVQIGNETNYNFCGETNIDNICTLLSSGIKAVRHISDSNNLQIETALHFTNPEIPDNYSTLAGILDSHNVDYDIFASSYYPYWHGTLSNLVNVLSNISSKYDKKVLIAETAYPYTFNDTDDFTNNVTIDNFTDITYEISPTGQRLYIYNLAKALTTLPNCIGFFYWEPAWISVGNSYNENIIKWEQFGSGWATSFAASYDASDAAKYYGGSSWDNQALFDEFGRPLSSLSIFKDIR